MNPAKKPHSQVMFNCTRLGIVNPGFFGECLRFHRHYRSDWSEAKLGLTSEPLGVRAHVVDNSVFVCFDAALCTRPTLVGENRPYNVSLIIRGKE